ncbi:pyruvate flavodoxin/ferredoxin oxidoreductase domain protein, partial [mine drainage metagenome]
TDQRPYSQGDGCDILYAMTPETAEIHAAALRPGGTLVYDPEKFPVAADKLPPKTHALEVPTLAIARKYSTQPILQNAAGLGASAALAGIPLDVLHDVVRDSFGRKAGDVVQWNLEASAAGYQHALAHGHVLDHPLTRGGAPKLLMTGNQAIALGAAAAGLKFLSQYPMTPASSIMHWLA